MTFLCSTASSLKSIFGMVVITSPNFSSHCPCWTSASVLRCFGTGWLQLSSVVFLLVLRPVSVVVLWFALSAVGSAPLLPAVGYALLPAVGYALLPAVGYALLPAVGYAVGFALLLAVGFALLGSFHHCIRSSMFLSLSSYPCCFTSFFSGSVSDSHHWLLGCGSVGVSLSPLALRLWFRLCIFFRVTLWLFTTLWFASGFPPTPQLSIAPLRDPREGSLQQLVLLSVRSGLRKSLLLLLVGVLQCHCVMLWIVSTFTMKAFIAASCHCGVLLVRPTL